MTQYKKTSEIWAEKSAFDFEKLLDPYREGGTQNQPVRRTMGTIIDFLVNKKKYPVDVVGAAILIVFTELFNGKQFSGDGTFGSMGRELVTYIRMTCDKLLQKKKQDEVFAAIAGGRFAYINEFIKRSVQIDTYPWWKKKIFKRKKWKQMQNDYLIFSKKV